MGKIEYSIGNIDEVFDEKGNTFLALREVAWGSSDKFRLDIRKWITDKDGEEQVGKGVSFLTDDGPNDLTVALLKNGYGKTGDVINSIKDRDDFSKCIDSYNQNNEVIEDTSEYYDPSCIFGKDDKDE